MRKLVYPEHIRKGSENTYLRQRLIILDTETMEVIEPTIVKLTDTNQDTITRMPTDFNIHLGNLYTSLIAEKKLPKKTSYEKFLKDFYSVKPNTMINFSLIKLTEYKRPLSNYGFIYNDKFKNHTEFTSAITKIMFPKDWDKDFDKHKENDMVVRTLSKGRYKVYLVAVGLVKDSEGTYLTTTQQIHELEQYIESPVCALRDFKLITDESKETVAIMDYFDKNAKVLFEEAVKIMLSWEQILSED